MTDKLLCTICGFEVNELDMDDDIECPHQEDGCDNCKLGRDPIDCQDALRDYLSEME